ncbi:MAG: ribonuclease E/G [Defluviitaleaceae bacterium]|nr:ribonuclease E/G [Defluviitaleaceae bacterium]
MKRLLIDRRLDGIFTAITENGKLTELYIDPISPDSDEGSWVGKIIVGRIKTILPGQFAFVDIGGKKNAFMNLRKGHGLKAGQPVLVLVEKDAFGEKGMFVSLEISLKGRFIVLYAKADNSFAGQSRTVGVSRRIPDEKEVRRLRKIARNLLPKGYGAIIRTNAKGRSQEEIAAEIENLQKIHADITRRAEFIKPPATLYPKPSSLKILSDILSEDIEEICINTDDESAFAALKMSVIDLLPNAENRIFRQEINITKQIKAALKKEVHLPCGGFITIEQTEACVVIDVNTGSNVGKTDYRAAVLETNLEAAVIIAAQMKLRNLSGIIIIDFIDMMLEEDRSLLLNTLRAELKKDRIRTEIAGFIGLGMVQLTRRKTRPPLSRILEKKCPHCGSTV